MNPDIPTQPVIPGGSYIRTRRLVEIIYKYDDAGAIREERVPVNDECVRVEGVRTFLLGNNISLDITEELTGETPKFAWVGE